MGLKIYLLKEGGGIQKCERDNAKDVFSEKKKTEEAENVSEGKKPDGWTIFTWGQGSHQWRPHCQARRGFPQSKDPFAGATRPHPLSWIKVKQLP